MPRRPPFVKPHRRSGGMVDRELAARASHERRWALFLVGGVLVASGCSKTPNAPVEHRLSRPALYDLQLLPDGTGWAVDAVLPVAFSGERLCAPALGTRRDEALEWAGAIADGENVAIQWDRRGCFDAPEYTVSMTLSYRARMASAQRPAWRATSLSPHVDEDTVFFPGESLFIDVESESLASLAPSFVVVRGPDEYGIVSSLDATDGAREVNVREYQADTVESLLESVLWAEKGMKPVVTDGLEVAVANDVSALSPELLSKRVECLSHQLDGWITNSERPSGTLMVLVAGWDRGARAGFARSGGGVLQVGADVLADPVAFESLIAHELFHRYNGHTLHYHDDEYDETAWFREGMTSYVAAVTLAHAGLIDEDGFVGLLEAYASTYLMNPARHPGAATDQALERRIAYDRGMLISLALDATLRDISGGERSLLGFWRHISQTDTWQKELTNGDIVQALNRYAGADLGGFIDRYAVRGAEIPVHALLRNIGVIVEPGRRAMADPGMTLTYDVDNAWLVVADLDARGPAAAAGIRVGDVIHSLPTTSLRSLDEPVELQVQRGNETWFVRLQAQADFVPSVILQPGGAPNAIFRAIVAEEGPVAACRRAVVSSAAERP